VSGEQARSIPIFDGHNDVILSLRRHRRSFFEESEHGHIDLPRARKGGFSGGFFAVSVPDPDRRPPTGPEDPGDEAYSNTATFPPIMGLEYAQNYALSLLGGLINVAEESNGEVEIVTTAGAARAAIANGKLAMELHIEGAEMIDRDLEALEVFYRAGVRSLGPVWSRNNIFGQGVPFQFPASPDTGPGLTDAGKALVKALNRLKMLVDVSHLNEKGFWDIVEISDAPFVATHTAAHAVTPATRNLTDRQLDALAERGGVVGINFNIGFLRRDGGYDRASTTVEVIADHIDYVANRIGIDKVAFGSDFDGSILSPDLKDVAGLPVVIAELVKRGYDDTSLRQIACDNWLRVLETVWGE
jgi:membrane dipeptidase